jgi:hypothetical protein
MKERKNVTKETIMKKEKRKREKRRTEKIKIRNNGQKSKQEI